MVPSNWEFQATRCMSGQIRPVNVDRPLLMEPRRVIYDDIVGVRLDRFFDGLPMPRTNRRALEPRDRGLVIF